MASSTSKSHFKKIQTINPTYAVATITQYESTRTGMRVAVVDRKSTKVMGEFALATEIHDDSGAPHTLEHLIFLVSDFVFGEEVELKMGVETSNV
jgi:Zn-dependent M16 (insulinase) family peptidase